MDKSGKIVKEGQVNNRKEEVARFLARAKCDGNSSVVLEATRNWTVMCDLPDDLVGDVHLAIAEAKIKTDKIDARVLAHLLRANLLPEAYVASPRAR